MTDNKKQESGIGGVHSLLCVFLGSILGLLCVTLIDGPVGLGVGATLLLAGFGGGLILHRNRFRTPLQKFVTRADRIVQGEDLLRFPVLEDPDLANLAKDLNQILTRLTETQAALVDGDLEAAYHRRELDLMKKLEETNIGLEKRVRDLAILFESAQAVGSSLELQDVLEQTCKAVGQFRPEVEFTIFLYDSETEDLKLTASHGLPEEESKKVETLSFGLGEGIVGNVFENQQKLVAGDVTDVPAYTSYKGLRSTHGSLVSIPLLFGEKPMGVINFALKEVKPFSNESVQMFETLANLVVVAIRNAQLFQATHELAIHDELTGLYNRRFVFEMLDSEWERSRRFGSPLSVFLLDIDHFKKLNDTYGHLKGDDVLRKLADVLQLNVRRTDNVGRYGGEEFLAILPNTDIEQAQIVSEKVRTAIAEAEFAVPTQVTISGGIACTSSEHGERPADLLALADSMLYKAKGAGRNQVIAFEAEASD